MGAVCYLKQTKADGKIPVNIHELWLKLDVCEDSPFASHNNYWEKHVVHNLCSTELRASSFRLGDFFHML